MEFYNLMNTSCSKVNLHFDETIYDKFIKYKDLLKEWNDKVNLTAIIEDKDIIQKHFIDSIKIFKFQELFKAERILDVGTGAGFPGLPIKIMKEDINVVLLDSLNKRINFLNEVINSLKLVGIEAVHSRAEDYMKEINKSELFDIVVSRAVANLTVLSEFCIPYVKIGGYFAAMKGPSIQEELLEAKNAVNILGGKIEDIIEVDIEETDLKHNLVIIKKLKDTPKIYPRKAGMITKNPLK